jgi:quercetin dioxygenase-like cupin family protein
MTEPSVVGSSEPWWFLGTLVYPKLSGEQTGGRFAVWENVFPRDAAPPLHTHPQDETFYLLEGRVVVWVDDQRYRCEPGAVAYVPGGVPHTFRVESDTARMLFISTPAGIEQYVRDLSEPARWPWLQPPVDGPRVSLERLEAVEREHHVVRLAPAPAPTEHEEEK